VRRVDLSARGLLPSVTSLSERDRGTSTMRRPGSIRSVDRWWGERGEGKGVACYKSGQNCPSCYRPIQTYILNIENKDEDVLYKTIILPIFCMRA
jgi:hypothetical protein